MIAWNFDMLWCWKVTAAYFDDVRVIRMPADRGGQLIERLCLVARGNLPVVGLHAALIHYQ